MNKDKVKLFKLGSSIASYIPSTIRNDSTYPFTDDTEEVYIMEIVGESLVIRKPNNNELNENGKQRTKNIKR